MADGQKTYPELKYKFIRGLLNLERHQRRRHYLKQVAEWTCKAIISLEFSETPIKSVRQATQLNAIGDKLSKSLKEIMEDKYVGGAPPTLAPFCSAAPAILLALYRFQQQEEAGQFEEESKPCTVPEEKLKALVKTMCEESVDTNNNNTLCLAWWKIRVLATMGYVKKRTVKKQPAYELRPAGQAILANLWPHLLTGDGVPQNILQNVGKQTTAATMQHQALYTNDVGRQGIVLCVDPREWGGDRVGLGKLARMLEQKHITYRTQHLRLGDYTWMWRYEDKEYQLPLIVERKRADDLVLSLVDQRYHRQIESMRDWRNCVLHSGLDPSLKYILEGKPEDYRVNCADGCGALVRCGFPSLDIVMAVLEELETVADMQLIRTEHIEGTVQVLQLITVELQQRVRAGDFFELLEQNPESEDLIIQHSRVLTGTMTKAAPQDVKSTNKTSKANKKTKRKSTGGDEIHEPQPPKASKKDGSHTEKEVKKSAKPRKTNGSRKPEVPGVSCS